MDDAYYSHSVSCIVESKILYALLTINELDVFDIVSLIYFTYCLIFILQKISLGLIWAEVDSRHPQIHIRRLRY